MDLAPKVCLDASVVVVGIGGRRSLAAAIMAAILDGTLTSFTSPAIEEEWVTGFLRPTVAVYLEERQIFPQMYLNATADLRVASQLVHPTGEPPPCRDERDRAYLHCAQFANVPYIVSLDRDLLEAPPLLGTQILTPELFLAEMNALGVHI